tara:strand:+ start:135 stop:407 length:273 start_codon:yes stop_codon:yes gene_type:complete
MSFDWNRIHKHEEQVENDIFDRVSEQICSFYNVEDVADLTIEQMDEVRAFVDNDLSEYSIMQRGFTDVFNYWEDNQWDDSIEAGNDNELQ